MSDDTDDFPKSASEKLTSATARFFLRLDLGQALDHSALAIMDRRQSGKSSMSDLVRFLEGWQS